MSLQEQMPPADVMPLTKLEPYAPVDSQRQKAERLVEGDAARVRQRDAGVRGGASLPGQDGEKRRVESARHSVPPEIGMHIHGRLDRPPVCEPRSMPRGIRVPCNDTMAGADEPWIHLHRLGDAPAHLVWRR